MLIEPLLLSTPLAGFNGGQFVRPDLSLLEQRVVRSELISPVLKLIQAHQLDAWIYRGNQWLVRTQHGPHVDREEWTVKFPPTVVPDFWGMTDNVVKIVGVGDDLEAVARCEADLLAQFSGKLHCNKTTPERDQSAQVFAARSQPYYVDVTHPEANKGAVVHALAKMLNIEPREIATLGDMPNDMPMFGASGLSIAMGQTYVTSSSEEEDSRMPSSGLFSGRTFQSEAAIKTAQAPLRKECYYRRLNPVPWPNPFR